MSMEFKDYYAVLGVSKSASPEDIKKAFRSLARLYHPDVAPNKAVAEPRFKEINEANEVLSDPEKRRKYDELGANWDPSERQTVRNEQGFGNNAEEGAEFHFDGTGFSDFFEHFFGSRGTPYANFRRTGECRAEDAPFPQRGQDVEGDILVTLDEVLHGSTRMINLRRVDARTRQTSSQTLRIKIPPGVRESQLIRLAGKGKEGIGGGDPGNLYLRVTFAKHPDFRVRGADLHYDLELAPWEAVLGATIHIQALGGTASIKIPAGTQAGQSFRLRGQGLPGHDGLRGGLYVKVSIQVPTHLTPEEKVRWEQLAAKSTFNPRKPL